jgi:hypothetical protein
MTRRFRRCGATVQSNLLENGAVLDRPVARSGKASKICKPSRNKGKVIGKILPTIRNR